MKFLVFTDLAGSTHMVESLGDAAAAEIFAHHDRIARNLIERWQGREIDRTDGFFLLFDRAVTAVGFALAYHEALRDLAATRKVEISSRVGIYLDEVRFVQNTPEQIARGMKQVEVLGRAVRLAERLMDMGEAGQTLLTRPVLELAISAAKETPFTERPFKWVSHGEYTLSKLGPTIEICDIGDPDLAPFATPESPILGDSLSGLSIPGEHLWIPRKNEEIPGHPHWVLKRKLRRIGDQSDWVGIHVKTGDRRVFKITSEPEQLKMLKREVAVFRLLREELGDRADITPIHDWNFDAPPYFLEMGCTEPMFLDDWAEAQGGLDQVPLETRLDLMIQVATTLDAAHSVGVLHKCLSPKSVQIQLDHNGRPHPRLCNFGYGAIARPERLKDIGISTAQMKIPTLFNAQLGVSELALYLAPEVQKGQVATLQSDVYSLGVLMYQMVIGSFEVSTTGYWQERMSDKVMRDLISDLVDSDPNKRLMRPLWVVEQLQNMDEKRSVLAEQAQALENQRLQHENDLKAAVSQAQTYRNAVLVLAFLLIAAIGGLGLSLFAGTQSAKPSQPTTTGIHQPKP